MVGISPAYNPITAFLALSIISIDCTFVGTYPANSTRLEIYLEMAGNI